MANCTGGYFLCTAFSEAGTKVAPGTASFGIGFVWSYLGREVKNPSPKMNLPLLPKCAALAISKRASDTVSEQCVCVYVPDLGRECCREQWCWRLPRVSLPRHPASDLALSCSRYSRCHELCAPRTPVLLLTCSLAILWNAACNCQH